MRSLIGHEQVEKIQSKIQNSYTEILSGELVIVPAGRSVFSDEVGSEMPSLEELLQEHFPDPAQAPETLYDFTICITHVIVSQIGDQGMGKAGADRMHSSRDW